MLILKFNYKLTIVWAVNLYKCTSCSFFAKNGGFTMAVKKKIINIRVYFDGDQDAKEVFAEVIAQKLRDTKTKDNLAHDSTAMLYESIFFHLPFYTETCHSQSGVRIHIPVFCSSVKSVLLISQYFQIPGIHE